MSAAVFTGFFLPLVIMIVMLYIIYHQADTIDRLRADLKDRKAEE